MTGIDRRGDTPMGPPWPVDVLADLHAGVYEPTVADELWPRVRHDPGALGVLDALDATRAELSGLAAATAPRMPEHLAARLDAAMAAEAQAMFPAPRAPQAPQQQVAPVVDLARARRTKRLGWSVGALVAAAAVAVVVIAIPHGGSPVTGIAAPPPTTAGGNPASGSPPGGPPEALTGGQLGSTALAAAIGRTDYGPLKDPAKRAACLTANHLDPNQTPAGAMQVTLDGKPGTLMVLTTGRTAQYRLLVVGPDCAAGDADTLADTVVGGVPPTTR
jgi:hypothetical protein